MFSIHSLNIMSYFVRNQIQEADVKYCTVEFVITLKNIRFTEINVVSTTNVDSLFRPLPTKL